MSTSSREQSRSQKAAAVRAAQERRERNRRVGVTAGIVVLIAAVIAGGFWFTRASTPTAAPKDLPVSATSHALVLGKDSAPVKVVVYEDFLCPYCQQLERQTRSVLHSDAANGTVQVEYRPFRLLQYDYSALALNAWGQVLKEGTPQQALAFHDALYDNQPYEQDADSYGLDDIVKVARDAGVPTKVTDTFSTQNDAFLSAAQKSAQNDDVSSTPTVLVDGQPLTGSSIDELVANLEAKIKAG